MTDRDVGEGVGKGRTEDSACTDGAEELLIEPVDVFHEYGVAAGSGIGNRIDDEGDRVRTRIGEALGAVEEDVSNLMVRLFGTDTHAGVYVAVRRRGEATAGEVADETDLPPDRVENVLEELAEEGVLRRTDGGYKAVEPREFVKRVPERVGDWIRDSIGGNEEARRLPIRGEKPQIDAEYDEENNEVTVRVEDPGDADYVEVLVGAEVEKYFEHPSEDDEFTVDADREQAVVARSGCLERS